MQNTISQSPSLRKYEQRPNKQKALPQPPASPAAKGNLETVWHLVLLLVIFIPVYLSIIDDKINVNGDNIFYHLLGKALAEGRGYINIQSPLANPHNHFPPGYPFIISLFMRLGFTEIPFYCYLNGFFTYCSVVLLYYYINKLTGNKKLAFVAGLLALLNTAVLTYAAVNMSEVPFMLFSILVLWALAYSKKDILLYKDLYFVIVVLGIIAACYIRTAGVALLLATLLHYLVRRQWKHALTLVVLFVAAMVPWQLRTHRLGGNGYMHQFVMVNPYREESGQASLHDYIVRIWENLSRYLSIELPVAIFPGQFRDPVVNTVVPTVNWVIGGILVVVIVYSLVRLLRKQPALSLYVFFAGGILLLWPSVWKGVRFMLPLMPLFFFLLLYAVNDAMRLLLRKVGVRWNPIALCCLALLTVKPIQALQQEIQYPYDPGYKNYFDVAIWAKDHLPQGAVVCCRKTELFYLFSQKKSIGYLYSADDEKVYNTLCKDGATYVVVDGMGFSSTPRYLLPAVNNHAAHFEIVYHVASPDTYLLKLHR